MDYFQDPPVLCSEQFLNLFVWRNPTSVLTLVFLHCTYVYLTPWSTVLLDKLIVPYIIKKPPASHAIWRFSTVFTGSHHLSLSWSRSIQVISSYLASLRSIIIYSHLCLGLPSGFLTITSYACLFSISMGLAVPISFLWIWSPNNTWWWAHEASHFPHFFVNSCF